MFTVLSLVFMMFTKRGTSRTAAKSGFMSSGFIWALREIFFGVSKFRRFMGLGLLFVLGRYLYKQRKQHA